MNEDRSGSTGGSPFRRIIPLIADYERKKAGLPDQWTPPPAKRVRTAEDGQHASAAYRTLPQNARLGVTRDDGLQASTWGTNLSQVAELNPIFDGQAASTAGTAATTHVGGAQPGRDGQAASTAGTAATTHVGGAQPGRGEQHILTADPSSLYVNVENLLHDGQQASTQDAAPGQAKALNLIRDVHQAPTTDPALPQVGALNPVHDGQRTSSPDTALFQVEASNLEMDFRYAPTAYTFLPRWESTSPVIDVYYAATPDTSELHEESPNLAFGEEGTPNLNPLLPELEESAPMIVASESSTSNGPSVDPQMIQLVADLLGRVRSAHGGVDLFFDTVYHLEQIFSRVPEHRRPFIGHFIANLPIKNQVYEELMEVFQIIGYPDPIRRGDIQLFLKTLTLELGLDAEYMQAYNHQFLSRFYLAPDTRDYVIQWMILILWWRGIPTRILHAAVGLMDLYTWLRPITRQDYQLLALAAITMSIRTRSPNIQINHFDLCTTANHVYTQGQILRMEEMLRECIGRRINFPTPHRFLDLYLFGLTEFTASMLEWSRKACNYIFELGLCQDYLCRYSASLRCCAVLYLIRQILRLRCDCSPECPHHFMPAWTTTLVRFTGHRETMNLKRLAKFYGQILLSIEEEVIPHYLAHHTNVQYTVVFSKYVREEYNAIAMDLKIRFLTQDFLNTFMTT